jgi:2-polyprenyl-6-methoxyphenol hydroxylase-like FAD-dependent oxidoreductase
MSDYDVAIVGYGPTGMTLAALLGQLGRRVIVLERYAGLYNLPRAACFDDEIMRTFQKLGLVDEISRGAEVQPGYEWVNGTGQILLDLQYDNPARGGWAALYMMFQPYIEAVLDRHDESLPTVEVRQGITVRAICRSPCAWCSCWRRSKRDCGNEPMAAIGAYQERKSTPRPLLSRECLVAS